MRPAPIAMPLIAAIIGVRIVPERVPVRDLRVGRTHLFVVALVSVGAERVATGGQVEPRAERLASSRQHDDAHRVVTFERPDRVVELRSHREVERVHRLGPVQCHRRDSGLDVDQQMFVGLHVTLLWPVRLNVNDG